MPNMNIKSDDSDCCRPGDYDRSPTIWLSEEQCEALGITAAPPAGTAYTLKVRAVATTVTTSVESSDEANEGSAPDVRLTLQLTDIEIVHGAGPSAATVLYGGS